MSKSTSSENSHSIFTLANLPIRMVIYLSVIGAMILPSYVNNQGISYDIDKFIQRVNSAKTTSPLHWIDIINRTQKDYYLKHQRFSDSLKEIALGIQADTSKYSYRIVQPMMPVQDLNQSATSNQQGSVRMAIAYKNIKGNTRPSPADIDLKNYLGIVYTLPQTSASGETEIITRAALCEMTRENPLPTTMPKVINGSIQCPNGANKLGE